MVRYGVTILSGILGGLLAAGLLLLIIAKPRGYSIELIPPPTPEPLHIHVCGAIAHPGVYQLPAGSIVADALDAAGGPAFDAAIEAINLANPLEDGQQVYVPHINLDPTTASDSFPASAAQSNQPARININLADAPELEKLPGIGPSIAQSIVDYRDLHGPFASIDDLIRVSGIGSAKLIQIEDLITLH
jgi:competence protein ComEA